jgi:hypothetical protein
MKSSMLMVLLLALCLPELLAESAVARDSGPWKWSREEGKSLSLSGPAGLIWRLNFGRDLPKPYFHPLRTVEGHELTWLSPEDHPWHLGLWFSWKTINKVTYWEFEEGCSQPPGRTVVEKVEILETNRRQARVRLEMTLRPGPDADPVARETLWLRIETPRAGGAYAIDWRQETEALRDVFFGRTDGYGGLSFRADRQWSNRVILRAKGPKDGKRERLYAGRWVDLSATRAGAKLGLTIFDHPTNPRFPTCWWVIGADQIERFAPARHPFYYTNAALLGEEPLTLKKGGRLNLFYRILVHPGAGNVNALEEEFARFCKSAASGGQPGGNPANPATECDRE